MRVVRAERPAAQFLEHLPVAAGAAGEARHRPLGKDVVARELVDEIAVGVDEAALRLRVHAAAGAQGLPGVGAQDVSGLRVDELPQRERPRPSGHGRKHRREVIGRVPVVVIEVGDALAVGRVAQDRLQRAAVVAGVDAAVALRRRVAEIERRDRDVRRRRVA